MMIQLLKGQHLTQTERKHIKTALQDVNVTKVLNDSNGAQTVEVKLNRKYYTIKKLIGAFQYEIIIGENRSNDFGEIKYEFRKLTIVAN